MPREQVENSTSTAPPGLAASWVNSALRVCVWVAPGSTIPPGKASSSEPSLRSTRTTWSLPLW
eukprot:4135269-Prymnesium_polylepis.1